MGIELGEGSLGVLLTFLLYLFGVAALGVFAHRFVKKGSFVSEYFLGNRGLGPWVLALTIAATAISGGTFMGFPSFIYTNGWVLAVWICSYMVVPLTAMVWLGKRINQVARIGGSVTVPDVFRDRFQSPTLGVTASLLLLFFLCFNLVAQFKAGGKVMETALRVRPAEATLERYEVKDATLILHFDTGDQQKTPFPSKEAEFDWDKTRHESAADEVREKGEVHAYFKDQGKEVVKKVRFPPPRVAIPLAGSVDVGYLLGLIIFAVTVIAYTTYGGFWAVTWTDVLEGLVMLVGVVVMAILALNFVKPIDAGGETLTGLSAATERLRHEGANQELITGPGPGPFLPLGMAISYFIMWSVSSAGQPSGMVRLMSFKDTKSLRRAMVLIAIYYILTYVSLLVIFICARAIFPNEYLREVGSEGQPDSIMPEMARYLTREAGVPWLAGLLLAAPYAAIMSTVAAFLLMISSSLVRDLYQRTINPDAKEKTLKRVSYMTTAVVGIIVMVGAINPPQFLQYVIVFTGSGQSCAFFFPMVMTLYWKRTTRQGVLAGMIGGGVTVFLLYLLGWLETASDKPDGPSWPRELFGWLPGWGDYRLDGFGALNLAGFDPIFWGFLVSLLLTIAVSLRTRADADLVKKFFP